MLLAGRNLLVIGLGLDEWATRSAQASGNRDLKTLTFSKVVSLKPIHVEARPAGAAENASGHAEHADHGEADHGHDHHLGDPHMWLDPVLMKQFVGKLEEVLCEIDPAHAADYKARAKAYAEKLDALNAEYEKALAPFKGRSFVSFHSAFTYLAARYGLRQHAVFQVATSGLNPKSLESVVTFIRKNNVRVVFAEPQFPESKLKWLVEETKVRVGKMDPLGNPAVAGYDSYLATMRSNLKTLVNALRGKGK